MSSERDQRREGSSDEQVTRFLQWTLQCRSLVVQRIDERLARSDAAQFLERGLQLTGVLGSMAELLGSGRATV